MKLTVTKVRYGDDLGVPQAAKIDGRYVVVFAKVTGTDEKRSVPMYDALRDLLRIEQVPGVTAPFGSDPQPTSDDLRPDTILVTDDAEPMGDLAPGLTYTLAFVWRQAPGQPVPTSVRVAAYSHTFRQASIDDTVDWRDPVRAAVGTFPATAYEKVPGLMRLPRPSRAQLGAGALVLAALSVGRVVTEWLPDGPSPVRAFERHDHPRPRGPPAVRRRAGHGRRRRPSARDQHRGDALPRALGHGARGLHTAGGQVRPLPTPSCATAGAGSSRRVARNVVECDVVNPGIPGHCLVAFEVDPAALAGSHLALTNNLNDQRGDDMAVVDLRITAAQVATWQARTTPVELVMPKATS